MAVTITHQPDSISPVFNTNYFRLIDSDASMSNYKYIVKLYYKYTTAALYTLAGTFTQFPLQDGTLEFDANSVLCNYMNNTYDYKTGAFAYRSSIFQYKIVISRTYSTSAETVIYTFDPLYVFDAGVSQAELDNLSTIITRLKPTIEYVGLTAVESTVNRSISNVNTNLQLSELDYYSADFFKEMPGSTAVGGNIGLAVYYDDGWIYYNAQPYPTTYTLETNVISQGIGPMNIKTSNWLISTGASAGSTVSGQSIFSKTNFTSYSVYINTTSPPYQSISKPITVNVCRTKDFINTKNFDRTWLVYKSRLGGWSYLSFNMKLGQKQETKQTTFKRRLKYNETYTSRGTTVISSDITTTYTLNTDWVPDNEMSFYEDLFSSPQVYMLRTYINRQPNLINPFTPVIVSTTSTPIYSKNNDHLFQYTIEVQTALQTNRQRF